ncbi:MAG: zinc ribbon domain-containing protein [Ruminococcus sp.]|nr:zinc ribbon domain-containing protein [Ruminococcus sp.]
MADNIKICKYCRSEIDKKAKVCPHCQKKQGSGCGTVVFVGIVAAIGLSIVVVKSVEPKTPASSTRTETEVNQVSESDYKASCKNVSYEEIARAKDGLKGEKLTFTGKIIQATSGLYRMEVAQGQYGSDDVIIFNIDESTLSENILEDDMVTIWGESTGLYTYKTVLGNEITVPKLNAVYIENYGNSGNTLVQDTPETTSEPLLMYDDNDIKIYYLDLVDSGSDCLMNLYIENNSDKNITVQVDDFTVNGFVIDTIFSSDVPAKKKSYDDIVLMGSSLDKNNIFNIEDIEFYFQIINSDDWLDTIKSESVTMRW